jgi:tRNA A-37 threonylcarbamoyl transferase component Bud32
MADFEAPMITVGGRYVLVEEIDTNDDREVWRGHDDLASRQVVVKLYDGPDAEDTQWRQRFDRQATRLRALSDPGIASVLDHDAAEAPVWIAFANITGEGLDHAVAAGSLTGEQALRTIGQIALAVKAVHDVGLTHGALSARHVMLRPGGSVALIGFDLTTAATATDDIAALRRLAGALLDDNATTVAEADRFLRWLAGGKDPAPTDPGDIGRTALALAVAARGDVPASSRAERSEPAAPAARGAPRPWYDEAERKRVRNGLIALGTIVVVAGAALLWLVDRGGGPTHVSVPSVIGLTLTDAQNQLTGDVLRVNENITDPTGVVTAQSPTAGTDVKVGTTVTLTISESAGG